MCDLGSQKFFSLGGSIINTKKEKTGVPTFYYKINNNHNDKKTQNYETLFGLALFFLYNIFPSSLSLTQTEKKDSHRSTTLQFSFFLPFQIMTQNSTERSSATIAGTIRWDFQILSRRWCSQHCHRWDALAPWSRGECLSSPFNKKKPRASLQGEFVSKLYVT